MTEINDLPVDVWIIIFRNLSIKDLLNCRLVNKKFKDFSDHSDGINYLFLGRSSLGGIEWYKIEFFKRLRLLSIFNLDRNLKRLVISFSNQKFNLLELSNLINLESLEVYSDFGNNYENNQFINLINLKSLYIEQINMYGKKYYLNTPKLENIDFYAVDKIHFKSNPDSIKHLRTANYDDKLKQFKNLETMIFYEIENLVGNLLSIFEKLKYLETDNNGIGFKRLYESIHNQLIQILDYKLQTNNNIHLIFRGIKLVNSKQIKDIQLYVHNDSVRMQLIFQINNSLHRADYKQRSKIVFFRQRFKTCKSLILKCPINNCRQLIEIKRLTNFQIQDYCQSTIVNSSERNFTLNLHKCHKCSTDFTNVEYRNYFLNNLKIYLRTLISKYYETWSQCEDRLCKYRTRKLNGLITKIGQLCPQCNERILCRELTDAQIYLQFEYFVEILNTQSKLNSLSKCEVNQLNKQLPHLVEFVEQLASVVKNYKNQMSYGVVDLTYLFSKQTFSFLKT